MDLTPETKSVAVGLHTGHGPTGLRRPHRPAQLAVAGPAGLTAAGAGTGLTASYLPTRIGTSSGVTLGLAISIGGLVTPVLGALADATSLHLVTVLAAFPVAGLVLGHGSRKETASSGP
jgi:hypothetical protein